MIERVASWVTGKFWMWTLLGLAWAWLVPAHFTWFLGSVGGVKLTALGLGVIMLGMGVTLTARDFREVLKMPWQVGIGVAAQFLLMPFVGWGMATLFALPPELKLGVILVSCCPGGTASNVVCFLARGNLALSVLMTMTSTLLAVVLTPLLTKAYGAGTLEVDAGAMIVTMVTIVLLPIFAGVLLNQFFGPRLKLVKTVSPVLSVLVIVLIVGAVVGATRENIIKYAGTLIPAVLTVHLLGFSLGYVWAKLFKLGLRECRTVSIEVGMQNSGLGSELAKTHFNLVVAAPCAISAFFHCVIGSVLASWWSREQPNQSKDPTPTEAS